MSHMQATREDKNFDALAERFERRVYGGLKGEIRLQVLWRDLCRAVPELTTQPIAKPLRVLDLGGGLGQFSVRLAELGHKVVFNDLSAEMAERAQNTAKAQGIEQLIQWHIGPYQTLAQERSQAQEQPFDLILCHALLEWLAEPELLIPTLKKLLADNGILSLCYYNPAAKIYRNLIRGNFDWLEQHASYQSDAGSLTPNHPCTIEQVQAWLQENSLIPCSETGIRVFSDYVVEKRGGHQSPEAVLKMELKYSELSPYKHLGRYQHILCKAV